MTRKNKGGRLVSANYCRPVSAAVDPVEKKPLFHFFPGSLIFSTGPNGCTFKCSFCQNSGISQEAHLTKETTPEKLAESAAGHGSIGIAYTYSEPIIWFESIMETGAKIRERGLKNVMVTNGFIEPAPLRDLLSVVDAMNIDIKSMNPSFYRRLCKGSLEPVLAACKAVKKAGCHLEITHLLIPGENDGPEETAALADFIEKHLGKDTPLHISRYFPRYRMDHGSTPSALLERAWEICRKKLEYVYLGNIAAGEKENTFCPTCGKLLISRSGYSVHVTKSLAVSPGKRQKCLSCGATIPLTMQPPA